MQGYLSRNDKRIKNSKSRKSSRSKSHSKRLLNSSNSKTRVLKKCRRAEDYDNYGLKTQTKTKKNFEKNEKLKNGGKLFLINSLNSIEQKAILYDELEGWASQVKINIQKLKK